MSGRTGRTWIRHGFLGLFGLALVAFFIVKAEPRAVLAALDGVTLPVLILALALFAVGWPPRFASLHQLAARHGFPLPGRATVQACLGSNALNVVTPARIGDAALVAALTRHRSFRGALSLVLVWRAISLLTLLALVATALALLFLFPASGPLVFAAALLGYLLGAAGLAALAASALGRAGSVFGAWGDRVGQRFPRSRIPALLQAFGIAARDRVSWSVYAKVGLLLALATLADVLVAMVFILAIVPGASLVVAFFAPVAGAVGKLARITPGGVGIYEGVVAGVLLAGGAGAAAAVAAAALAHAFVNLLTVGVGVPSAFGIARSGAGTLAEAVWPDPSAGRGVAK